MKVLFSYTLSTIRRNKTTSLSIIAAVLLASTLLCAICTYGYTQLKWRIEVEEYENGQWHGELGGKISPESLSVAEGNLHVAETMVKGPFSCLQLSKGSALPYLLLRDADGNYWQSMGEKNLMTEGRPPREPGEITVSKSFFEQNPQYQLGDTITLPAGQRYLADKLLQAGQIRQEGEYFRQEGTVTVTLVGKLDITTNTTVPGYYAMGYLDRAALTGEEELVVYVKFTDIRETYEMMPQIAETIGIEKDEYGNYQNNFRYHTVLLIENFVFGPEGDVSMGGLAILLVYGAILLLAAGAFVMIIHGAFQVSASARMRQLGMFRSIGATPAQIGGSILMEGLVLSLVPILMKIVDIAWSEMLPYMPWEKMLLNTLTVMATVAGAYLISAGKIKKDTIIEAVRDENLG